jgi:outer membrane lipoprotein-sorting protein
MRPQHSSWILALLATGLLASSCFTAAYAVSKLAPPKPTYQTAPTRAAAMQADFTQVDSRGTARGTVTMASGGRLRWDQLTPTPLLLVSDGSHAWQVDPDLQQAVILNVSSADGWAKLMDDVASRAQPNTAISLPRDGTSGPFSVFFGPQGHPVKIVDAGSSMRITFSNWKPQAHPDFSYAPPKGYDVIGR